MLAELVRTFSPYSCEMRYQRHLNEEGKAAKKALKAARAWECGRIGGHAERQRKEEDEAYLKALGTWQALWMKAMAQADVLPVLPATKPLPNRFVITGIDKEAYDIKRADVEREKRKHGIMTKMFNRSA